MKYHEVLKQEQRIGNLLSRLKELKKELIIWNENNATNQINEFLPPNLKTFPAFDIKDYSEIFIASLKTLNENEIPVDTKRLLNLKEIVDVGIDQNRNILSISIEGKERKVENFTATSNKDVAILNNLIYSIRKSNRNNLLFYSQNCLENINERVSNYQDILNKLQVLLIQNSRIKIKVTIYNNGKEAVVLHPFFKLTVYNDKNINEPYLMNTINWELDQMKPLNDYLNEIKELMKEDLSEDNDKEKVISNDYKSFFQDKKTFPHLSIPGGANITVILETSSNLSDKGNEIKKWFESGALFCRVDGLTVDNDLVNSPEILFNANIQDKVKTNLGL